MSALGLGAEGDCPGAEGDCPVSAATADSTLTSSAAAAATASASDCDMAGSAIRKQSLPDSFMKTQFGRSGGVDGYVFVLDTSADRKKRHAAQWNLWESCWERIPSEKKSRCVLVISKCDELDGIALDKTWNIMEHFTPAAGSSQGTVRRGRSYKIFGSSNDKLHDCPAKLAVATKKHTVPVFLTSAEDCVGVDQPFLYLAHLALKLHGRPQASVKWKQAVQMRCDQQRQALLSFLGFLKANVTSHAVTWRALAEGSNHGNDAKLTYCRQVNGLEICKAAFKSHLFALIFDEAEQLGGGRRARRASTVVQLIEHRQRRSYIQLQQEDDSLQDGEVLSAALSLAMKHEDLMDYTHAKDRAPGDGDIGNYECLRRYMAKMKHRVSTIIDKCVETPEETSPEEVEARELAGEATGTAVAPGLLDGEYAARSSETWRKLEAHLVRFVARLERAGGVYEPLVDKDSDSGFAGQDGSCQSRTRPEMFASTL
eukprot:scpid39019/ scgid1838/ 